MRLAYLTALWPAPSETFLAREVAGLRAAGVDVTVLALRSGNGAVDPAARYAPGLLALVSDMVSTTSGDAWRRLPLARLLSGLRSKAQARHLLTARWVAQTCADLGAEALHAAWANLPADLAWMAHQLGAPAYTVAGHARDVFVRDDVRAAAWSDALGFVACNREAWRTVARRQGPGRVTYVPHGLPLAEWPLRAAPPSEPLVLGVGRLVRKKGFDLLVRAVAASRQRPPVVILGDGPERAALASLAHELEVSLTLPGMVSEDEVRAHLAQASVLVLPSRQTTGGDRDGLANVLLEAMASGTPVITTTAGSAADAVEPGRTGWLLASDDLDTLAAALDEVLADSTGWPALIGAARALVEQRFDAGVNTSRLARWLTSKHAAAVGGGSPGDG